jgi:hypothetical protein
VIRFDGVDLRGAGEARRRLDAHDGRDARGLELAPAVTEEGFDGGDVEPAAHLVGPGDGEVLAGGGEQTALLELVLQRLALGFVGLERQVDAPGKRWFCSEEEAKAAGWRPAYR